MQQETQDTEPADLGGDIEAEEKPPKSKRARKGLAGPKARRWSKEDLKASGLCPEIIPLLFKQWPPGKQGTNEARMDARTAVRLQFQHEGRPLGVSSSSCPGLHSNGFKLQSHKVPTACSCAQRGATPTRGGDTCGDGGPLCNDIASITRPNLGARDEIVLRQCFRLLGSQML